MGQIHSIAWGFVIRTIYGHFAVMLRPLKTGTLREMDTDKRRKWPRISKLKAATALWPLMAARTRQMAESKLSHTLARATPHYRVEFRVGAELRRF